MAVWASVVFCLASLSFVAGVTENVAQGKPAWMSTTRQASQSASNAVDGVTRTDGEIYSVHTKVDESSAWWKVDLQTPVQSPVVNIYFRTDYMRRRNGLQLYTSMTNSSNPKDGDLCDTVRGNEYGTDIQAVLSVTCPGTWRYLTIYTEIDNDGSGAVLDFAEVQVWVSRACTSEFYGTNCGQSCGARHCKMTSVCDAVSGQCVGGCAAGYQGTDCTQACSSGWYGEQCSKYCSSRYCQTPSNTCDHVTGKCPDGCAAGYTGDDCLQISRACTSEFYGTNCGQSCGARHCKMTSVCDAVSGQCVGGCAAGYQGTDCTQVCFNGQYREGCSKFCSSRYCKMRTSTCDPVTGMCPDGCAAGYTGDDCSQACESGRYGDTCIKYCISRHCFSMGDACPPDTGACSSCQTGWARPDCTVCAAGYYGADCSQLCINTHCMLPSPCGAVQWSCVGGCAAGYHGQYCTQACTSGNYGANCVRRCVDRHCRSSAVCGPILGQCVGGCAAGYQEPDCTQVCENGKYGDGCNKVCSSRHCLYPSNCPPDTGACSNAGCRTGWTGTDCTANCGTGFYGANCGQSCAARRCKMDSSCDAIEGQCVGGCAAGYQGTDCRQGCIPGMYGEGCRKTCSSRRCKTPSDRCAHVTGKCPDGCVTGFTGDDCLQNCPDGYYGTNCSLSCADRHCSSSSCPADGACDAECEAGWTLSNCSQECPREKYGVICSSVCGHCADNTTCHHITGTCPGGCQAGWKHPLCQAVCDNGTYGLNCERECGQCNGTCDAVDGRCPWGCTEGYNGSHCSVKLSHLNDMQSSDVLVPAVAGTVAGLLVVAIVVVVVVLVGRRRRRSQDGDVTKHSAHFRPGAQENGAFANVVLDENRSGKQKPPIKPKPAPQAASSKQLGSEDDGHEEEDLNEEVQPPDSYYNAEAEVAIRDVAVPELAATVAMLKQRKDGFEREYNRLVTGFTSTYQDSQRPENSGKNRFRGYYPYDHNRIRLTPIPNTPGSDYINASLMHSYNQGKTYIAAQAPNKNTVGDFWRMIWEHSCSAVVMLTGLVEEAKVKCEQYWPDAGVKNTEHFKVEVEATQIRANFTTRHMKVTSKTTGENRSVIQFHFTSWPDHGVPDTLALVQYIWLVRETVAMAGPLLVHCSAGIGRTGTYIAVDSLIDQARDEGVVDVLGYVTVMRGQRKNMIQTAAQYACVFHCLVEMTTFGRTSVDVSRFTTSYSSSGIDTAVDGRTLRELSQMLLSESRDSAPNRRRMWVDGNSDFIVHVGPTLTCVRGFLLAVAPSSKLVKLLWKLVEENNVHNIIVVTPNLGLAEAEGRSKTHGGITVTTTSHTNLAADLSMMNLQLATKGESPRRVKMINADAQLTMETVTSQLLNHAELENTSTQTTPVVVVHSKTHEKLAVSLCIMGNIMSGIREDTRVDVIGHVRMFLRCCPGLQFEQSDVQMFHDFALQCIQRTDPANTYANV